MVTWTVTQTPLHHAAVDAAPSRGATEVTGRRVA
jgi:hypothetical protein